MADLGVIAVYHDILAQAEGFDLLATMSYTWDDPLGETPATFVPVGGFVGVGIITGTTQTGTPPTPTATDVTAHEDVVGQPMVHRARSDADGNFILHNLKTGRYRIVVEDQTHFPRLFLVDVMETIINYPTNLSAGYAEDESTFTLSWEDASQGHEGFRIYRSEEPMELDDLPEPLAEVGADVREWVDDSAEDGRWYFYRVGVFRGGEEKVGGELETRAGLNGDPHWENVVSLLRFDGDFSDETGRTWVPSSTQFEFETVVGAEVLRLDAPLGPSQFFLSTAETGDFIMEGDFTVECYVHPEGANMSLDILASNNGGWFAPAATFRLETGRPRFVAHGPSVAIADAAIPAAQRSHIALCRRGGDLAMYVNGEAFLSFNNYSTQPFNFQHRGALIFNYLGYENTGPFAGLVDNFRITKGIARYTENFTPPTKPFPNW